MIKEIKAFKENPKLASSCEEIKKPLLYEPNKGEKIHVVYWVRYPSYDFIFGYPDKTNPYYKDEVAFYQFRDTRAKTIKQGFYLDCLELEEVAKGFSLIFRESNKLRPKLWNDHIQKMVKKKAQGKI